MSKTADKKAKTPTTKTTSKKNKTNVDEDIKELENDIISTNDTTSNKDERETPIEEKKAGKTTKKTSTTTKSSRQPKTKEKADTNEDTGEDKDMDDANVNKGEYNDILSMEIESKYQQKTQKEHILDRPDTYIGSVACDVSQRWIVQDRKIILKDITISPAFYNIVEEILVNAYDNFNRIKQRIKTDKTMKQMTYIKINIDKDEGKIQIENDGEGIDIAIHPKNNLYVPQMIFGELLTGGNYNDAEERITGGRNGYGAKLTNIYSLFFCVETIDHRNKKHYHQIFRNNNSIVEEPIITKTTEKPYTRITFIPDYKRFGMEGIDDDFIYLVKKRCYDLLACSNNELKLYFNDEEINSITFEEYMNMYIDETKPRIAKQINSRWTVGCCLAENAFTQISFVNGINTNDGGQHVEYIQKQLCEGLLTHIKKKHKIDIKPTIIRDNLMLFVNAVIVNPSFSGQTKDKLTTKEKDFGSTCIIDSATIDILAAHSGIVEQAIALHEFREAKILAKTDGKFSSKLYDIPKLEDAYYAGTNQSANCSLILTEGDSAKTMAIRGLQALGEKTNKYYGVFPLRGKLINTRDISVIRQASNMEICYLKRILGLQENKEYTNPNELRYGRIIIMTDQDSDGSHIKGLLINFFSRWMSLLRLEGFITSLLTPIVKATRKGKSSGGDKVIPFYTLQAYKDWQDSCTDASKWHIKYYKGLGTSDNTEAKSYFEDMQVVVYKWDDQTEDSIDKAFSKARANDRKDWLLQYEPNSILDIGQKSISFTDFVNKDLIHFSHYDCERSIPSMIDGFKPSQRKVLYGTLQESIDHNSGIKVAQLASAVSKTAHYHHGEVSLQGTIVGMAQDYIGSNNITLLKPMGQFGSRIHGGSDSASPRYIFTDLDPITHKIFNKLDEPLYKMMEDEGHIIEPMHYIPIIPMVLINGNQGIGTGWSSKIPAFNPLDIVGAIKALMNDYPIPKLIPWHRGYTGLIEEIGENQWITHGKYELLGDNKIRITELPIGLWIEDFKDILNKLRKNNTIQTTKDKKKAELQTKAKDNMKKMGMTASIADVQNKQKKPAKEMEVYVKSFVSSRKGEEVEFIITFENDNISELIYDVDKNGINKLEHLLKLTSHINATNMHLFDENGKLRKYESPRILIEEFYNYRLKYYTLRKDYLLNKYRTEIELYSVKIRFIEDYIEENIKLNNVAGIDIFRQLYSRKYPLMIEKNVLSNKFNIKNITETEYMQYESCYDYLLSMQLRTLSKEKMEDLRKKHDEIKLEIETLESKTNIDLWKADLADFEAEYAKHMRKYFKDNGLDPKIHVQEIKKPLRKKIISRRVDLNTQITITPSEL